MRRWTTAVGAVLAALCLLSGCGGGKEPPAPEVKDVDLTVVYGEMEKACEWWTEGYMVDIEGEMLEMYYPGLDALETEQRIARMAMMSATANEVALVECKSEEDAGKAEEIFQARIDYQVGDDSTIGGAFYPESIEAWKKAQVLRQGNYVAMIAVADTQDQLGEIFNNAFA